MIFIILPENLLSLGINYVLAIKFSNTSCPLESACLLSVYCLIQLFIFAEHGEYDPQTVRPGSRYSHVQEVQERLNFLRLVLT